jgi:hypothetical protein
MIVNPAIIALTGGSLLTVGFAVYASMSGIQIHRQWNLTSGSESQLLLERRTHLISTLMAYLLGLELFSFFLFIHTADHLHPLFVGAMCAAGSFNVNGFGYPALVAKMVAVLAAGIWLMVNHADGKAPDTPLIRLKYRLLPAVTSLLLLGAFFQIGFFKGLRANVITSCCGTLFSTDSQTVAGLLTALPARPTMVAFYTVAALHLRSGMHLLRTGGGGRSFGVLSAGLFLLSLASIFAWISVYYYQLPTHHCPFDLLQGGYHYVGYPLYASLFVGAITGMGTGVLATVADSPSLAPHRRPLLKRYCRLSLTASLVFTALSTAPLVFSDFTLAY